MWKPRELGERPEEVDKVQQPQTTGETVALSDAVSV